MKLITKQCVLFFLFSFKSYAFAFGIAPIGNPYDWTQVETSYESTQAGDYVAKFIYFDPQGNPNKQHQPFKVIYRSSKEKALLESYMLTYPNNPPYEGASKAILGFAVYLGQANYQEQQGLLGEGTQYEAPWSVVFKPYVMFGIAEFAPEVCDGLPSHYNYHGTIGDTSLSVGTVANSDVSPAPQYCPWSFHLGEVYLDGQLIWDWEKGHLAD